MPQGTPTSLCPMLSPPHPTSSGGDEDPSKLVRCRGVPAPQTSSGHPKSATPLLCPAWLLRGGTGMLRRCLPGLICGVAQPSRAAQRAAGRELTRGGRRGGCFESLPRSGREALGLPSRAASRQPGSHTLVEDEPSLLACPPPEPGCPRPPLTSVPKHQRGCRCSANQPPRGHPGAPQPLFWHPGSRSGGDDDGCVGATRRQPRSWGRAPGAWPGGTRGQAALHHGRPPLGPGAQQAAEAEGAWGARGDVEVVGCIQLASPYPVALVRRGGSGMGAPRYPLALGRGLGGSVGLLRELFGYLAACSALVFLFSFFPGGC